MDANIIAGIVQGAATVLGAGIGVGVIVWQLRVQAQAAIDQVTHNEKIKLQTGIYEEFCETQKIALDACTKLTSSLRQVELSIEVAKIIRDAGLVPQPPRETISDISANISGLYHAQSNVLRKIEQWLVIEPKLFLFNRVLTADLHLLSNNSSNLNQKLYKIIRQDEKSTWTMPDDQSVSEYVEIRNKIIEELEVYECHLFDFINETQMLLMKEVYPTQIQRRNPQDAKYFVVRLDAHDDIVRFLENEHHTAALNRNIAKNAMEKIPVDRRRPQLDQ